MRVYICDVFVHLFSFKETSEVPPASLLLLLVHFFVFSLPLIRLWLWLLVLRCFDNIGWFLCFMDVSVRLHPFDMRCSL